MSPRRRYCTIFCYKLQVAAIVNVAGKIYPIEINCALAVAVMFVLDGDEKVAAVYPHLLPAAYADGSAAAVGYNIIARYILKIYAADCKITFVVHVYAAVGLKINICVVDVHLFTLGAELRIGKYTLLAAEYYDCRQIFRAVI